MQYELFYLVGESKEPKLETIKESVKKIVTGENYTLLDPQITERRKMSYRIKGESYGTYVAQRFEISEKNNDEIPEEKEELKNISKKIRLNQDVLRFIIVKADNLPELKLREAAPRRRTATPIKKKLEKSVLEKPVAEKKPEAPESIDKKLEEILKI